MARKGRSVHAKEIERHLRLVVYGSHDAEHLLTELVPYLIGLRSLLTNVYACVADEHRSKMLQAVEWFEERARERPACESACGVRALLLIAMYVEAEVGEHFSQGGERASALVATLKERVLPTAVPLYTQTLCQGTQDFCNAIALSCAMWDGTFPPSSD